MGDTRIFNSIPILLRSVWVDTFDQILASSHENILLLNKKK
jgi:hypothetical protein